MGGALYYGENPTEPQIGNLKITFEEAAAGPVSVIATQLGHPLEPFSAGQLGTGELLKNRKKPPLPAA